MTNHPVHIIDEEGNLTPSAFIPFCGYGGNMSAMGLYTNYFDAPVCNSFKAKILNERLCYEVDIEKIFDKYVIKSGLKVGLMFLLDYNEDRQMDSTKNTILNVFAKNFIQKQRDKNPLNELGKC